MDDNEKMTELRVLTDSNESDQLLLSFIRQAGYVILTRLYPYKDDEEIEATAVPKRFEWKQIQVAAFLMNKRGAEGEIRHNENGIVRHYKNAYVPEDMLWDVVPMVGIPR